VKLEELLPLDKHGDREFLPSQLEAVQSSAKYLGLVGGVGSAKTVVASVIGVFLSMSIPGNRGVILRHTYTELHDSTWATFLEVLERTNVEGVRYLETHHNYPHRVILPNDSEIYARETKNPGRYLGPEYGWFFLDEAGPEPESTVQGLMRRLRLPQAGKYLKGILATNPPPRKSWYAKMFPRPGIREEREVVDGKEIVTKYQMIRSRTRDNKHLPPGYLANLLSTNPDSEIARIIDGHYGFSQEGVPVYPQFSIGVHVRGDVFRPRTPIIRGWDFGFHHPACTWHQLWRCKAKQLHWSILHELDGSEIEATEFLGQVLLETKLVFPDTSRYMFVDAGDRAGAQVSDKGPGPIIRAAGHPWFLKIRHKACPIEPGLDLIRKYLSFRCPCGLPGMLIDPGCLSVIEGMQGGYHYPKNYKGMREEVPQKDKFFDDFQDSVRYVGENIVRLEEKGPGFMEQLMATDAGIIIQPSETDWLGLNLWPTAS
jgi:hypothetical protein